MSQPKKYDKEKVWQGILLAQKKRKQRKALLLFFFLGLCLSTGWLYNQKRSAKNIPYSSLENSINEKAQLTSEKTFNNSIAVTSFDQSLKSEISDKKVDNTTQKNSSGNYESDANLSQAISKHVNSRKTKTRLSSLKNYTTATNKNIGNSYTAESSINGSVSKKTKQLSVIINSIDEIPLVNRALLLSERKVPSLPFKAITTPSIKKLNASDLRVDIVLQNSLGNGALSLKGSQGDLEKWQHCNHLDLLNYTDLAIQLTFNQNWLIKAGFSITQAFSTYDHTVEITSTKTIQHDSSIIYSNIVLSGSRTETTTEAHRIVNNNKVISIGLPIGLGHRFKIGNWQTFLMLDLNFNLNQQFSGILSDEQQNHLTNMENINEELFKSHLSVRPSFQWNIEKNISDKIGIYLGFRYALENIHLKNSQDFEYNYNGFYMNTGLRYALNQ